MKSMAYKCFVHPSLKYACSLWNPHTASDKATLETVQWCAVWWVAGSHWSPLTNQWSKFSFACLQDIGLHLCHVELLYLYVNDLPGKLQLQGLVVCSKFGQKGENHSRG